MPSWRCAFPVELRGSAAPTRSAAGANDEALGGGDLPVEVPRAEFHSPGRLVDAAQLRDGERLYTEGRRQRRVLQLGPGGPVSGHSKAPVPQINGDRAQSSTSIARADPSGQPHPAGTSDPLSVQRSYFEPLASCYKPDPRGNSRDPSRTYLLKQRNSPSPQDLLPDPSLGPTQFNPIYSAFVPACGSNPSRRNLVGAAGARIPCRRWS